MVYNDSGDGDYYAPAEQGNPNNNDKPPQTATPNSYGTTENYICDTYTETRLGDPVHGEGLLYMVPDKLIHGDSAPAVIFLHGWPITAPSIYRNLLEHLAFQGYVVIFPQYCKTNIMDDLDQTPMLTRAIDCVNVAIREIGHMIETDKITIVGYSNGGEFALCWASEGGIPPRNMVLMNPNIKLNAVPTFARNMIIPIDYASRTPATNWPTILICGEDDVIAPCEHTQEAYDLLTRVPTKVLYRIPTDRHGDPALVASHLTPLSIFPSEENVHDIALYTAVDAALDGQTRVPFDLGTWDDGTPILEVETLAESN